MTFSIEKPPATPLCALNHDWRKHAEKGRTRCHTRFQRYRPRGPSGPLPKLHHSEPTSCVVDHRVNDQAVLMPKAQTRHLETTPRVV